MSAIAGILANLILNSSSKKNEEKPVIEPKPNPVYDYSHIDSFTSTDKDGNQVSVNPDSINKDLLTGKFTFEGRPATEQRNVFDAIGHPVTVQDTIDEYNYALNEGYVNKPYVSFSDLQRKNDPRTAAWVDEQNARFGVKPYEAQQESDIKRNIAGQNFDVVRNATNYNDLTPKQGGLLTSGNVTAQNLNAVRQSMAEGGLGNPEYQAQLKRQQDELLMRSLVASGSRNVPELSAQEQAAQAMLGTGQANQRMGQLPLSDELYRSAAANDLLKNRVQGYGLGVQADNPTLMRNIAQSGLYREAISGLHGGLTPEQLTTEPYMPTLGPNGMTVDKNQLAISPARRAMEQMQDYKSMLNGGGQTLPAHVTAGISRFGAPQQAILPYSVARPVNSAPITAFNTQPINNAINQVQQPLPDQTLINQVIGAEPSSMPLRQLAGYINQSGNDLQSMQAKIQQEAVRRLLQQKSAEALNYLQPSIRRPSTYSY